jgi:hypothetical protein
MFNMIVSKLWSIYRTQSCDPSRWKLISVSLEITFPCSWFSSLKVCRPSATSDLFFLVFSTAHFSNTHELGSRQGFTLCSLILLIILDQISAQESAKGTCLISRSQPIFLLRVVWVSAHFGLLPPWPACPGPLLKAAQGWVLSGQSLARQARRSARSRFWSPGLDSPREVSQARSRSSASQVLRFPHWYCCCASVAGVLLNWFCFWAIKKLEVF